ncbi:MAG: hypothetical protein PHE27_08950 [Alphaproteobacteria bacterium]|nr:hypothetical protein [Alphaproteobacteria bacterium]
MNRNSKEWVECYLEEYLNGLLVPEDEFSEGDRKMPMRKAHTPIQGYDDSPVLRIEFRKVEDDRDDLDGQDFLGKPSFSREEKVCLTHQSRKCADVLLRPVPFKVGKKTGRLLAAKIREAANTRVYAVSNPENPNEKYIFALGENLDDIVWTKNGEIAVVAGTTIALPFDKASRTFYLPSPDEDSGSFYSAAPGLKAARVKTKTPEPDAFLQPSWEPTRARTAKEALKFFVPLHVAAWCLEQQPGGGRRFIECHPRSKGDDDLVRNEHSYTYQKFRRAAVEACSRKWGEAIPSDVLDNFMNGQITITSKNGDRIPLDRMNVHHNWLVSWGGGNDTRTLIDIGLHTYIHQEFNRTCLQVCRCLNTFGGHYDLDSFPSVDASKRFLTEHPQAVQGLRKIPNVRVDDEGRLSIGILWPEDNYCIPSLMQFEIQYGGIYGPGDKEYVAPPKSRRPDSSAPSSDFEVATNG